MIKCSLWKAPLSEGLAHSTACLSFAPPSMNASHLLLQFMGPMFDRVLWCCWPDCCRVWATKQRIPGSMRSSRTPHPPQTREKPHLGQRLLKPWWLLTVISSWVYGQWWDWLPLLPIKTHRLCPQVTLNGISVLGECVCAYVSEERVEPALMSRSREDREKARLLEPKGLPSAQARVQPIRRRYLENHDLTSCQIIKGVYVHLSPGEWKSHD